MLLIDLILTLCFGLIWGSFLNVCIYRIPRGQFWSSQRSFCPNCQSKIPFYLNIPLFSYLFLFGKSACCQKKISLQYPSVELVTAILLGILFYRLQIPLTKINLTSHNDLLRLLHVLFLFQSWLFALLSILIL